MRKYLAALLMLLPTVALADALPNVPLVAGCLEAAGSGGLLSTIPCRNLSIANNLLTDGSGDYWSEVATASPVPILSSFTWANQGSSAASQKNGVGYPILMQIADSTSVSRRWLTAPVPATPYSILVQMHCLTSSVGNQTECLVGFRNSSGVSEYIYMGSSTSATNLIEVQEVASDTATATVLYMYPTLLNQLVGAPLIIFRLRDNGTTLFFDYSFDGDNFINAFSEAVGTHLTPTLYEFGGQSVTSTSGTPVLSDIVSIQILNNANP